MAIGSGLGASWGMKKETTYVTGVTVDRWIPFTSAVIKPEITREPLVGMAAGRVAPVDALVTGRRGTGTLACQVPSTKFGAILQQIFGSTPTPTQQAATTAYLQAYTLTADLLGMSFTAQVGAPLTTGTANPYTGTGGKVVSAEFSGDTNGICSASLDMAFQQVVDSTALASPSYVAYTGLNRLAVKIGSYGSEAAITGIRNASIRIERPQDVERPGTPGAYPEPIANDFVAVSGTLTADFVDETYFNDKVLTEASTSLVIEWTNDTVIASTYYPTLRFKVPKVRFLEPVPEVGGPEILSASVAFTGYLDTTNGLVACDYISTDTAI